MRLGILSLMLFLLGFLVSSSVVGQQTSTNGNSQLRVTTIRIDRGNRYNARPESPPSHVPGMLNSTKRVPQRIASPGASVLPLSLFSQSSPAGQVGYQQPLSQLQNSPSDYQTDRRESLQVPPGQLEVTTDSRYEILDYRDARYPDSEYRFIEPDVQVSPALRQPIGFCRFHHQNNPFCKSKGACGDASSCCDEWSGFCECYGLSSFRYWLKKDCFYGVHGHGCRKGCGQSGHCAGGDCGR